VAKAGMKNSMREKTRINRRNAPRGISINNNNSISIKRAVTRTTSSVNGNNGVSQRKWQ